MAKKVMGSFVLAGLLASGVQAVEITPFGKLGVMGNFGFGDGNTWHNESLTGYVGVVGHAGVDFNFNGLKLGIGAMAGYAPLTIGAGGSFTDNAFVGGNGKLFARPWVDVSDLYIQYQGAGLDLALGRYNASKILTTADWVGGYNQGVALAYQSQYFGIWGTWINDWLRNGYNAGANLSSGAEGRYGMDIAGFGKYPSSWDNFGFNNELFSLGMDFKIGENISLSPYAQYWSRTGNNDVLQAGGRLILGFDLGAVKTTTTARALWSHAFSNGLNGFMWQVDEELLFVDMIKLGGGYMSIGDFGLQGTTLVDRTRFYGQYLYPYGGYSGTGLSNRSYLNAGVDTWYVFTGLKLGDALDFDVLYAGGDYKEFSAIINYNILNSGNLVWSVGGGFVSNGFGNANSGLAFTKLKF